MERNLASRGGDVARLSYLGLPGIMRVRHPITNLLQPERLRRQDAEKPAITSTRD